MKRHLLCSLIVGVGLLALAARLHADTTVVLSHTSPGDLQRWSLLRSSPEQQVQSAETGVLLSRGPTSKMQVLGISTTLPQSKNWRIDVTVRFPRIVKNDSTGIVAFASNTGEGLTLITTKGGRAYLGDHVVQTIPQLALWTQTELQPSTADRVVISLMKLNDAVVGYRNGIPVATYSSSMCKSAGRNIGVVSIGQQDVVVERCVVKEWDADAISVVDGAVTTERPVPLGSFINTAFDESVDCISPDGSQIFFSREERLENPPTMQRDVWVTNLTKDGWSVPAKLGATVNTEGNDFAIAVTEDMSTLFLQGRYGPYGREVDGVSYVMKTGATWSNPVNMRIEEDVNLGTVINSHLSPDGRVMISSRQSPDTYGGNDLYVSFRVGADAWSKPQNIGAVVNTHGMEMGPFIAGDNETMFFSSNGHPGFGGRDLYVTRRLDSTWLRWSEPKNLGPSYNSAGHETFIQVPAHGDSAYFSARLGNGIGDDIVALAMPKGAQPKATYTIIGEVVDGESNTPVSAEVKLVLMPSERFEAATTNDRSTGKFSVDVATASLYQVQVNVPGYKQFKATVDARGMQRYTAMTTKIVLERAEIPLRRDTSNITFAHGKAEVEPISFASLDSLAAYMRRAPKAKLVLQGHADEIGTPGANQQLSMERANAILERLMAAGIDPSRVTVVGYGESRPRASNATDEGRAQNRRVDVILR